MCPVSSRASSSLPGIAAAAALVFGSAAMAKGPFDGLEMDVIGQGQVPKGPTSRIALPRAPRAGDPASGATGYQDSIADSLIRGEGTAESDARAGTAGFSAVEGAAGAARPAEPIAAPIERPIETLPPADIISAPAEAIRPPDAIPTPVEPVRPETIAAPPERPAP